MRGLREYAHRGTFLKRALIDIMIIVWVKGGFVDGVNANFFII